MRTTVTLDAETERLLRKAMAERGLSFKAALSQAVRRGLADLVDDEAEFVVNAAPMGLRAGVDPTRLNAAVDELDVPGLTFVRVAARFRPFPG